MHSDCPPRILGIADTRESGRKRQESGAAGNVPSSREIKHPEKKQTPREGSQGRIESDFQRFSSSGVQAASRGCCSFMISFPTLPSARQSRLLHHERLKEDKTALRCLSQTTKHDNCQDTFLPEACEHILLEAKESKHN